MGLNELVNMIYISMIFSSETLLAFNFCFPENISSYTMTYNIAKVFFCKQRLNIHFFSFYLIPLEFGSSVGSPLDLMACCDTDHD